MLKASSIAMLVMLVYRNASTESVLASTSTCTHPSQSTAAAARGKRKGTETKTITEHIYIMYLVLCCCIYDTTHKPTNQRRDTRDRCRHIFMHPSDVSLLVELNCKYILLLCTEKYMCKVGATLIVWLFHPHLLLYQHRRDQRPTN